MSTFSYSEAEASDTDAKHLLLRQVAKDVTVRLSQPLTVANTKQHTNLLSISNSNGLAFAATNSGFSVIRLSELRSFFQSAARNSTPTLDQPLRSVDTASLSSIGSLPTFITSANNHSSVLVGFQNGAIAAWSVAGLVEGNRLEPLFVLTPPSPGLSLIDLVPNPSDRPELAVALYRQDGTPGVNSGTPIMLNLDSGSFGAQLDATGSRATAVCWSVKGKQVAVGLESGEIVQVTPEGEAKDRIAKPESLAGSYYVSDLRWLENHVFVATYNLPSSGSPDDDPEHSYEVFTILRDVKAAHITFAKMTMDPAPPYGDASRPGTRFAAWLKGWEPSKHLVFVASGPSTDVGLISCSSQDTGATAWSTVELEETSKPILPFSSIDESSDTAPVALDFDLTSTDEVDDPNAVARGDGKTKMPAVPILYVYTSDGVLLAYNVINTQRPFEGMVTPSAVSAPSAPTSAQSAAATSAPSQPSRPTPAPAPSAFGSSSAFGQPSAFGQSSAFGAKSAFGSSASPAFGQSSAFGSTSAVASSPSPAFGAAAKPSSGFGFGAFSSAAGDGKPASAFGSTSFGFGPAATATSNKDGTSSGPPKEASTTSSTGAQAPSPVASAFGTKPAASAFGASSPAPASTAAAAPTAFGSPSAFAQTATKPAFGQSAAFGQTSAPAFGSSSGFGSTSAFGSASAFGATPTSSSPFASKTNGSATTSSGSAFGGFASPSGSGFGSAATPSSASVFGSGGKVDSRATDPPKGLFGSGPQSTGTSAPASAFGSSPTAFGQGSFSAFAANKAAEAKGTESLADEFSAKGNSDAGSFSFGGLDGMLSSHDPAKSSQFQSQSKAAAESDKKDASSASLTSAANPAAQTPKSDAAPKSFSFNPAPSTTTSASSADDVGKGTNAAKATSPANTSAFSSFKPGFNAGASFGSQPFSFSNNKPSTSATTSTPTPASFGSPAIQADSAKKPESDDQKQDAPTSNFDADKKPNEPTKPAFSFANAPTKPLASASSSPSPSSFSFASTDSKALDAKQEAKPASPAPVPSASTTKASDSPATSSLPVFGSTAQAEKPASEQNQKSSSPFSFANSASATKPAGFGGFGTSGAVPATQPAQAKDNAFSFANLNNSTPSTTPSNAFTTNAPVTASTPTSTKPAPPSAPSTIGSFLGFNSSAPRSSSPLASAPVNNTDDTTKGSPEKQSTAAPAANKPSSFQQDISKPSFGAPTFGAKPAAASPAGSAAFADLGQSNAKKPSGAAEATPSSAPQPTLGGFGATPAKTAPPSATASASAAKAAPERSSSPLVSGRTPQLSTSNSQPPAKVNESGIQGEFLKAYLVLTQELDVLRSNVDQCAAFLADLREATARPESVEDFADASKWSFGDLPKMLALAKSLRPLTQQIEDEADSHKRKVSELQSLQLKAEAKREEVARFIRARSDPEFAKMIRIRQLGPEHVENQNKLRKASQVVRDRIAELEEYLATLKDKLQHAKAGRTSLKAPSLDSVARACRNITARTTTVTLELDNLALEMDLMRPTYQEDASREASRAQSRSVSVVSGLEEAGPLDDVSNLARTLPSAVTLRSVDEIARAERVKSESVAVFLSAREKPILNTRAVPSSQRADRKMTKPMQGSDLQIAFAKGPVHLGKRAPPAPPSVPAAPASQKSAPTVNGAKQKSSSDQFAPVAKSVPVPVLSKPPTPASSASTPTATAPKVAPLKFGFPVSPGPVSNATPAAVAPKPASSSTPFSFAPSGSPAAAAGKATSVPFTGFGAAVTAPATGAPTAILAAPAPKPAGPSAPSPSGGFSSPAPASTKPAAFSFGGLSNTATSSSGTPAASASAASSPKPAESSAPLNFGGFGSPAAASAKASPVPFSFGAAATPSAPTAQSDKPTSVSGASPAPSVSPFGSATLSKLDFGKLSSAPAGMFDLPAQSDTFQPGARAASSSPSTIRSATTTKSRSRGAAVQLPPAATSGGADGSAGLKDASAPVPIKASSDFFALPLASKPKDETTKDAAAPASSFKGFNGFSKFGANAKNSDETPKSDDVAAAAIGKSAFSFGDVGKKVETPIPALSTSSEAKLSSTVGGFSFGNLGKTDAAGASSPVPQLKPAASGFNFGASSQKSEEGAPAPSSSEQSKSAPPASFSFGDLGKKPSESAAQTSKPVSTGFSFGDFGKKTSEMPASDPKPATPLSSSFAPLAPAKSLSEEQADKTAAVDDKDTAADKSAEADEKDVEASDNSKEDAKDTDGAESDVKDADSQKADDKGADVKEADDQADGDQKDAKEAGAEGSNFKQTDATEAESEQSDDKEADAERMEVKEAEAEAKTVPDNSDSEATPKDEALPDPSTFTFCKPTEPRNKEPLTEAASESKETAPSQPDAKPAAAADWAAASTAAKPEKENMGTVKAGSRDSDHARSSPSNGAASADNTDDFSYPPKAKSPALSAGAQPPMSSTPSPFTTATTSAFSFAPNKLNPSSSPASAFGSFKSSPGFGFGAFSKPADSSSPSSKPVNAFSFAPQSSSAAPATPSKAKEAAKTAFGSVSPFGNVSGFGAFAGSSPSTPVDGKGDPAKSAFSFSGGGGFGAFASSTKTSPFAAASPAAKKGEQGDQSGASLLSRLGGAAVQATSDDEQDEEEGEYETEEDDDDEGDEDEEEYDDEEDYEDEEDYDDEEDEEDDDVDSGVGHEEADSLEESAVHVSKADALDGGDGDGAVPDDDDGEKDDDDEEEEDEVEDDDDDDEEDGEEGLSAVEEETEEEAEGEAEATKSD